MSTALSALTDPCSSYNDEEDNLYTEELTSGDFFGRHNESLQTLEDAYDEIKRTNQSKSVLVRGESGTGKTSLVLALRDTVVLRRKTGFFCMGKYSQDPEVGQDPYSAIMAAFSDLCDLVLQASDQKRVEDIKESLGSNGQYLARAVTNISPFLNEEPEFSISDMKDKYVLAKFKVACLTFLRAMSSNAHPVVLFLDDVQWIDAGSRELIEAFLQATNEIGNFMLIAAYREGEAKWVEDSISQCDQNSNANIDILLRNLDFGALNKMISSKFPYSSSSHIYPFSKLIYSRTQGNPYYASELIRAIERENCSAQFGGSFVINEAVIKNTLKMEQKISNSFASLLSQKVAQLNPEMQGVLKVATALGGQFSENILLDCSMDVFHENGLRDLSAERLQILLKDLVTDHFFIESNGLYQFIHDKLRVTVQDLMPWDSIANLHVVIGQTINNYSNANAKYQAAVHLNRAFDMHKESRGYFPIYTPTYYIQLAKINLEAAKYCQQISAFRSSILLLRKGLSFLPQDEKWSTHFALTFQMTKLLARMEFIVGNLKECEAVNREVLCRSNSIEKIPFLMLDVEANLSSHTFDTATARKILKELGIEIPRNSSLLWQTCRKLRKIRRLLGKKSDRDILNVPCTSDPRIITGTKMRVHIGGYWLLEKYFLLALFTTLAGVELSLEIGLSTCSPTVINLLGVIEIILGNAVHGSRLLELSLKLLKKVKAKGEEFAVTTNTVMYLLYRKLTLRECMCFFENVISHSFEMGEVIHICYSMPLYFYLRWKTGENLQTLMATTMRKMYHQLKDFGGELSLACIEPMMQFVLNLQSDSHEWSDLTIMTGEIMNEENFMSNKTSGYAQIKMYVLYCKFILLFAFGFNEEARALGIRILGSMKMLMMRKSFVWLSLNFYLAMSSYRLYAVTKKRRYIRTARRCRSVLVQQKSCGNPNVLPYLSIIEAKEISLKSKDVQEICEACNRASQIQVDEGFPHLEGLVYEETFRSVAKLGSFLSARNFLDKAKNAYGQKWGATAMSNWLGSEAVSSLGYPPARELES